MLIITVIIIVIIVIVIVMGIVIVMVMVIVIVIVLKRAAFQERSKGKFMLARLGRLDANPTSNTRNPKV